VLLQLPGGPAHSEFRLAKLLDAVRAAVPGVRAIASRYLHLVDCATALTDAEAARWVKAVQPVLANYKSSMVKKGFSEKEIDGYMSFIKERIEYWRIVEKEKGIPSAY